MNAVRRLWRGRVAALACAVVLACLPGLPAALAQQAQPRAAERAGSGAEALPLTAPPLPPAASGRVGSEVFRSVDDNGTPSFSQSPPTGRASAPVELKPLSGTIDTVKPAPAPLAAPAARVAPPPPPPAPPVAPVAERAPAAGAPRGLPFETYILIRRGMSEGELLGRAGPPDYRGNEVNRGLLQESWYYLPTPSDPFTTIIQMRGGRVVDTERIRKL
jgi:hypothetical protein